jgi:RNA polymerase sigma-70 factor (ECF subfamily)
MEALDYDSKLMVSAAGGDSEAYRELFERNYKSAVGLAYRFLGNSVSAEDVAMEAFLRIYQSGKTYKPSAKFTTYLYRIVANLCINHARLKQNSVCSSLDDSRFVADSASDPSKHVQKSELSHVVRKAVMELPPNQRLALVLTRYEGLSYESAAEVINVSVKALESLLYRAKQNLRKSLKDYVTSTEGI